MTAPRPEKIQFKILPATEEDCFTLAQVESIANNEANKARGRRNLSHVIFGPPSEASQSSRAKSLLDTTKSDPHARSYKAVVEENGQQKIVGWAYWFFVTEPQPIEYKEIEWPAGVNSKACNEFLSTLTVVRAKHMSGKTYGWLQVLATLPQYRGNGIGSALVALGLDEARKAGLTEFFLQASEDGHDVYEKFGFVDVEEIPVDLRQYGGECIYRVRAMRIFPN